MHSIHNSSCLDRQVPTRVCKCTEYGVDAIEISISMFESPSFELPLSLFLFLLNSILKNTIWLCTRVCVCAFAVEQTYLQRRLACSSGSPNSAILFSCCRKKFGLRLIYLPTIYEQCQADKRHLSRSSKDLKRHFLRSSRDP